MNSSSRRLSPAIADSYRGMVLLDALVFNTDRHPYNFGVLRDQATGCPLRWLPPLTTICPSPQPWQTMTGSPPGKRTPCTWTGAALRTASPESVASMELPVINRQVIESLLNPLHVPGFPEEEKQRVIGILAARWEKLREQISQYRTNPEHK